MKVVGVFVAASPASTRNRLNNAYSNQCYLFVNMPIFHSKIGFYVLFVNKCNKIG
jgi:hypothetical protein